METAVADPVDIRCPANPRRLLFKLFGSPPDTVGKQFIEIACRDCCRDMNKRGSNVVRVLHIYDLHGEHIDTVGIAR
jgi:hypothetical protein